MTDPAGIALVLTPVSVVVVAVINVWNGRRMGQVHADVKEGLRVVERAVGLSCS